MEPVIRISALTQASVMMEDSLIHPTFLDCNGIFIVLNAMKSALIETNYHDYPDSVIPCISIFKSLCIHNTNARHDLSLKSEIYHYTLRGIFYKLSFYFIFKINKFYCRLIFILLRRSRKTRSQHSSLPLTIWKLYFG